MDFRLSEEQEMMRKMARDLAAREIAPVAAEIDESGRFPQEIIKKMADAGLFGILIPTEFGGAGGDRLDYVLVTEELAAASASVASIFVKTTSTAVAILTFGTDEQKQKYLPGMASGEILGAFGQTETSSGANWLPTLRTRAVAEGDEYVVNGTKCYISNAGKADVYIVMVKTDPEKQGPAAISALIVDKDTPGFSFSPLEDKLGLRATPNAELIFEDCRVPQANLLGPEGEGTKVVPLFATMVCSGQAAIAVGLAQAALDASKKYVKEREVVPPQTLAHFDPVQLTITNMTAAVEAARLLTYRGVGPGGAPPFMLMSAIQAETMAQEVTSQAVTLHGRYGCSREFPVERYFRDAKTLSIHPVLDVVRATVGKILLGVS